MNPRRETVATKLAAAVSRLDTVLSPWGFSFVADEIQSSHCGPFASGHYDRDTTRIGISCRDAIDNLYYEHTFVTRNACSTESERFTIAHATLMDALGHSDECRLITTDDIPDAIVARDGGDRVDALIHDLNVFASRVLSEPCDDFYTIVRRGHRSYSVA
ncbi:hypothetical protein Poly51_59920 [Rubripirellula tenax]|uniref:Uncharacterized protein n=1 Tax=Rubripirellula tenax TaxID=2528015 RepID=A0A5C6E4X1_9BACT|nr:hypothetical protein [Rubripirellula tenax]TWU44723.1 hypothetical protein Poly51_59920 [Rubripirellula tenax]